MERSEIKRHILEGLSGGKIQGWNGVENYFRGFMDQNEVRSHIKKIVECVTELISLGLVIPYRDHSNYWKDWLGLSERGEHFLRQENSPYDPDGYLARINSQVSNADPIVFAYLSESVCAFDRHLYFASAVTLGAASERLILVLVDSANHFLKTGGSIIDSADHSIFRIYRDFRKKIDPHKNKIPYELRESYETTLDTLFNLIRVTRNDAGHPKKATLDKALVKAELEAFGHYLKTVDDLAIFFNQASR